MKAIKQLLELSLGSCLLMVQAFSPLSEQSGKKREGSGVLKKVWWKEVTLVNWSCYWFWHNPVDIKWWNVLYILYMTCGPIPSWWKGTKRNYLILLQLEFAEERHAMLKSNSEAFKKEASAAYEKSRSLQVALSKIQVTLDSVSQVSQCH